MGKQIMVGSIATIAVLSGEKLMYKIAKHPLLVFGLGLIGGSLVYKNRKAIIASATDTLDSGKNLVLQQKEKVLDLIAEANEGQ